MGMPLDPQHTHRNKNVMPIEPDTLQIEEERLREILRQQLAKRAQKDATIHLSEAERQRLPLNFQNPYGLGMEPPAEFITLPSVATRPGPQWLVELQFGRGVAPIGVLVVDDVVLGISRPSEQQPDLDLSPYGGDEKGVSRRHAVIRPSRKRLYLIDLQSTNGTRVNALPVGSGVAMELHPGDAISLGALTLNIKILAAPADIEKAQAKLNE